MHDIKIERCGWYPLQDACSHTDYDEFDPRFDQQPQRVNVAGGCHSAPTHAAYLVRTAPLAAGALRATGVGRRESAPDLPRSYQFPGVETGHCLG